MKKALAKCVVAMPYTSDTAVDRSGFLTAVLGVKPSADGELSLAVTHCDTETGTFEAVPDPLVSFGENTTGIAVTADVVVNLDVDLIGCKQFVKFGITGADTAALVLGDPANAPV